MQIAIVRHRKHVLAIDVEKEERVQDTVFEWTITEVKVKNIHTINKTVI